MKQHLVLLHGFGTDSRVFASFGHKLSKDHDVLMVDLPGHGQTKEMFGDFAFSAYTILHALDVHLKEPYNLLGWSMGGEIALEMWKQKSKEKCKDKECNHHHNNISSLILISTTPRFVEADDFKIGMNKAVFNKFKKGIKDDTEKTMDNFYNMIFVSNENASLHLSGLQSQTPSQTTLLDCMESFGSYDYRKTLPTITVPTLIIAGDKDAIINSKASLFMSQEIKGSTIKMFKDTGHAPFITHEKETVDEVYKFIG